MTLLFLSTPERAEIWSRIFAEAGEPMVVGEGEVVDPTAIRQIACWVPPEDLTRYPNLDTVICVGAGVDHMAPLPEGVALSRTLAPGIETMVRDWVVMATLMLHREMPRYLDQARAQDWRAHPTRPASGHRIGIMGMGRIGRITAEYLASLGFDVAGWSRSGAPLPGIETYAGAADLPGFLARSEILICLLPLTAETRGILNAELFACLPDGAALVHAGRGGHLDMAALRQALDSGQLASAMLDVTEPEPLPEGHWVWSDPRVIVTPHIASHTDALEGAQHALAVIRAQRTGLPIPGRVDSSRGY